MPWAGWAVLHRIKETGSLRVHPAASACCCRVRGALVVHPTFEAGATSMQAFFQTLQSNPPQRPQQQQQAAAMDEQLAAAAAAGVAASQAAAAAAPGLPAPQPLVPGGRIITQALGRGAEGALGDWTTQQGAYVGGGALAGINHKPGFEQEPPGMPGLQGAWQSKPLAQARMSMPVAASAPHAAAAAEAAAAVVGSAVAVASQQQQQQQPPWPPPRFASQCPGAAALQGSPPPVQAAAQLIRQAPLVEWASLDVSLYMDFLSQRGELLRCPELFVGLGGEYYRLPPYCWREWCCPSARSNKAASC